MINLEWFRSFRAVYKTKSLSKASELLMISQPTVSQHIAALETHMQQKLFIRKSKGVLETEEGKLLNTMVSGALENLESIEDQILRKDSEIKNILKIGVSSHLYKSLFCKHVPDLGSHVHLTFGTKQELKSLVENGKIYCAVVPEKIDTFDLICEHLYGQKLVLVASKDINIDEFDELYAKDMQAAEKWLSQQKWYSHDVNSSFIKNYWLYAFDKKRPAIIPNYIIPNEHEVLFQLSRNSGLCVSSHSTLIPHMSENRLHVSKAKDITWRELFLITNKKMHDPEKNEKIINTIRREVGCTPPPKGQA